MKRYIRANQHPDIEQSILQVFGRSDPGPGCTFISRDGRFVNIYPSLDTHEDLCEWVEDNLHTDILDPDGSTFVRKFGWVRLRSDPSAAMIELPLSQVTSAQYSALFDWLCYCEDRYGQRDVEISIETADWEHSRYGNFSEDFAEDLLRKAKQLSN